MSGVSSRNAFGMKPSGVLGASGESSPKTVQPTTRLAPPTPAVHRNLRRVSFMIGSFMIDARRYVRDSPVAAATSRIAALMRG